MTAIKKTNTKSTSPAPATNGTKPPAKKKAPAAVTTKAVIAPAAVTTTSAPVAAPKPVPPAVKPVSSAPVQTKIVANIDVGFGNALYIRGDGPGLSWSQGVRMNCVASDRWEFSVGESSRPVSFKVLLNDTTWCTGPDSTVASGATATITPEFV
jgi:hypothetical protein